MNPQLLDYEETLKCASRHLRTIKDLKQFCSDHDLNYNVVCRLRTKYTAKKYPLALIKTMEALNFQKIEKKVCFSFCEPVNL